MKNVIVVFVKGKGLIQGVDKSKGITHRVTRDFALKFLAKNTGFSWKG
ncbi:MAG TPA: hypothetical protein VGF75_02975 [Candidatus Saccharimonadales bacterium]